LVTLFVATPSAAQAIDHLSVSAEIFPDHGLPGISPTLRITIANLGDRAVTLPSVTFLMEETTPSAAQYSIGCGRETRPCGDYSAPWFDRRQRPGPFTLRPQESKTVYIGVVDDAFFEKGPLLTPGRYDLRLRLTFDDVPSNTFRYTVDQPTGEDLPVWAELKKVQSAASDTGLPFMNPALDRICGLHPTSAYSKVWRTFHDLLTGERLRGTQRIERIKSYIASGLPVAWDGWIRMELAMQYRADAEESAIAGSMAIAMDQAEQGKAILRSLESGYGPYTKDSAEGLLASLQWSREQLQTLADITNGRNQPEVQKVAPLLDCVIRNSDGTYTAWFGYNNPNHGILMFVVGPDNNFSPDPKDRGQTTVFQPGRRKKTFSVSIKPLEQLVWTLNGGHAKAEIEGDADKCGDDNEDSRTNLPPKH
jgi:hypothetical protein